MSASFSPHAGPSQLHNLEDLLQRAHAAHNAGRLDEADYNCRLLLAADKKQFDALHLLGLIEFQRGRLGEAHKLIRAALKINKRAANAYSNLGLVLQQLGCNEDALAALSKALAVEPNHLIALNNHGQILRHLSRPQEALVSLNRALAISPNYPDALCNRGNALVDLRRFEEALASYDRALTSQPDDAPTLNNRAHVLWALDRRDEAIKSYDRALALAPDDLSILKDRGTALAYLHREEEALVCFDRGLALRPDDMDFLYRRGKALARLERYDDAMACFNQMLAIEPNHVDALTNRAHILAELQRAAEAIEHYDRVLAIDPEMSEAHWHRGSLLLSMGNYAEGWKEYEWRWRVSDSSVKPNFPQPLWLGEQPIAGKTILVYSEQGFGDTIQFVRFVPLIATLGAKVILEVQPAMKALFSSFPGTTIVLARGEKRPPFDLHCPLLSLPFALKTRLDTIPGQKPYISVTPERLTIWKERLPKSGRPRIGVVWGGNPEFPADKTRSIGLPRLLPLLSVPGFEFVSLQKDLRPGDQDILHEHPEIVHLGPQLADFCDTAAVMSLLDLVISSDTAIVHLAGALGRPVWILLEHVPDWRWLTERNDSPWYPGARLFRQRKLGDWPTLILEVMKELTTLRPSAGFHHASA